MDDVVLTQLMHGLDEDMALPIHILATIKKELIRRGIKANRLSVEARGYNEPLDFEDSKGVQNRRFEIELKTSSEDL